MATRFPRLLLKPGREVHIKNRHHAVFRNAVAVPPSAENGAIVEVRAADGSFLCYATWNAKAYICARAIAFEEGDPLAMLRRCIEQAVTLRRAFFTDDDTTAYRLVNAEGDGIPGLIVDRYGDMLVLQCTTLGMDRLRDWVANALTDLLHPASIYEKSTGPARKNEGLPPAEGWVRGGGATAFTVRENGLLYPIDLAAGQKTGLFLDQRAMRSLVRSLAAGRRVLDCFSYVGGFALNALAGGALHAHAVDYDDAAIAQVQALMAANGIAEGRYAATAQDVFDFLRRTEPHAHDFIILDPPAFAKRSDDLEPAKKAYTDSNRMALQLLPPGGMLLTCSCSFQIDPILFQTIVFHAARQAKRNVRILQRHRQAFDHPVNIYHPETDYLKSLLLWVE